MTVKIPACSVKEKAERESAVAKSSISIDAEIDCSILVLGISQKTPSVEVMLEKEGGVKPFEVVQSKVDYPAKEMGQQPQHRCQHEVFDFVHIRFQNSGILDGPKVFRLAFEQTKPGGWIEVVEVRHSVGSIKGGDLSSTPNQRATHFSRTITFWGRASISASWVKNQLVDAGFVDVEEKAALNDNSSSKRSPVQQLWAFGKLVKGLCTGQWWSDYADSGNVQTIQEKSQASLSSPSVFVVARKPPLNDRTKINKRK